MKQGNIVRHIGAYLAVNIVAVGLIVLLGGVLPKTKTGWALLLIFGFPLWLLGEAIFDKLLSKRVSDAIDPSKKSISVFRIQYALFVALLVFGAVGVICYRYRYFWQKHFTYF